MGPKLLKNIRIPGVLLGVALAFISKRYFSGSPSFIYLMSIGVFLLVCAPLFDFILSKQSKKAGHLGESGSYLYGMLWKLLILIGVGGSILYYHLLGSEPDPKTFVLKALLAFWLVSIILGVFLGIGVELALLEFGFGEYAEPKRVKKAGYSWILAGLVTCVVIALNYTTVKFDKSVDWSFTKVTKPSEATRKALDNLTQPLYVYVFYPRTNSVLTYVREYLSALKQVNSNIQLTFTDKDMDPLLAEKLKVRDNGFIILGRDQDPTKGEPKKINIGLTLGSARKNLAKLDENFRSTFLSVSQKAKVAYFTVGHGENTWQGEKDPLKSINAIWEFLKAQNYRIETLSIQSGSMEKVPADASVVVILGPTSPFAPEEVRSLENYLANNGKIMVAFDLNQPGEALKITNVEDPLKAMFAKMGITFQPKPLADDRQYAKATGSPADKWFVYSNVFTTHEAVRNLSKYDTQLAVLFFRAGFFELKKNPGEWEVGEIIKSMPSNFMDENENYTFEADKEKKGSQILGVAFTKKAATTPIGADKQNPVTPARIVALADATVFSDLLVANSRGNQLLAFETFNWVLGTPELSGSTENEEDVKIMLKRDEELKFYYGTLFVPPIIIFGLGITILTMRKNRSKRRES